MPINNKDKAKEITESLKKTSEQFSRPKPANSIQEFITEVKNESDVFNKYRSTLFANTAKQGKESKDTEPSATPSKITP